jgi:protein-tyrosine-phosphatase
MERKRIEFVCFANHGRSPVAELIASNHIDRLWQFDQYYAASSGSHVDEIRKGRSPYEAELKIVKTALDRDDIFTKEDLDAIARAMCMSSVHYLHPFYKKAYAVFASEETEFREEAVRKFGIRGKLKEHSEQTIVIPDTIALFPMADVNTQRVQEIYRFVAAEKMPVIETITTYATNGTGLKLPNTFGMPKEKYFGVIEQLIQYVPMAIERVLREKSN